MSWTMEFFYKVIAGFIFTLLMMISHSEGLCRHFTVNRILPGKAMINHTFNSIYPVDDRNLCASICYLQLLCFSYNFCEDNIDGPLCELLDSDYIRHGENLVEKAGCTFYGSESSCSSYPCSNNATCQGDFPDEDQPYLCVCPQGFTGRYCEIEINECLTGAHLCHVNATCTHTIGGHNCTCKKGFYGNGIQCNDEDECTDGTHDCHVNATCSNVIGGYRCTCKDGFLGDGSFCLKPKSCEELKLLLPDNTTQGLYDHEPVGGGVAKVFCSFESYSECGAGPWTLAMKINGRLNNFKYDSIHWNQKSVFNPNGSFGGLDGEETVSPAYWTTPLTKLCLGMKHNNVLTWILISINAPSLYDVMANERNVMTYLGEQKWRSLLPKTSLEANCNMEGFNLRCEKNPNTRRLRLGFFTNNEDNCLSCQSYVGLGPVVKQSNVPTCGNHAVERNADFGPQNYAAFCYILIQ